MTGADVRDIDVPSVVAAVRNTDKFAAFDGMLEQSHFWETLEVERSRSGKSAGEFLVALKPNFMMTIKVEDPPLVYTDPELVERYGKSVPVVVIDGRERPRGRMTSGAG